MFALYQQKILGTLSLKFLIGKIKLIVPEDKVEIKVEKLGRRESYLISPIISIKFKGTAKSSIIVFS